MNERQTRPLRVAYVCYYDPMDITKWSGTGYHMHKALAEAGVDVTLIGPLRNQHNPINIARYLWNKKVRKLNDHPHRDPGFLRHYARQVEARLRTLDVDLVVGPGGLPLCYLETDLPIVVWTDCTFASLLNYYEAFKNMSARSVRDGHAADQALFDRCARAMFSCEWAADSAVNDYGYDPARCDIVSLGANVPVEKDEQAIRRTVRSRSRDELRLLFLGVQWVRKGGDTALAVGEELHRRGLPVRMDLVGAAPPEGRDVPSWATVHGFIRKSTEEGMRRISGMLASSHFMVLPTKADCTPIVFNEASSAALPVMTTRTGGVPSVVHEGVNGHLFDLGAPASAWADRIEGLWHDQTAYEELSIAAWRDFHERLNWAAAGRLAAAVLQRTRDEFRADRT
jgi:glycosyltransferase involved in cell wall biosynthesis